MYISMYVYKYVFMFVCTYAFTKEGLKAQKGLEGPLSSSQELEGWAMGMFIPQTYS